MGNLGTGIFILKRKLILFLIIPRFIRCLLFIPQISTSVITSSEKSEFDPPNLCLNPLSKAHDLERGEERREKEREGGRKEGREQE